MIKMSQRVFFIKNLIIRYYEALEVNISYFTRTLSLVYFLLQAKFMQITCVFCEIEL